MTRIPSRADRSIDSCDAIRDSDSAGQFGRNKDNACYRFVVEYAVLGEIRRIFAVHGERGQRLTKGRFRIGVFGSPSLCKRKRVLPFR